MSIIFVLIPIAVVLVFLGLGIFFWAVRSKQFDDLDKEALSILFDEKQQATNKTTPAMPTQQHKIEQHRTEQNTTTPSDTQSPPPNTL